LTRVTNGALTAPVAPGQTLLEPAHRRVPHPRTSGGGRRRPPARTGRHETARRPRRTSAGGGPGRLNRPADRRALVGEPTANGRRFAPELCLSAPQGPRTRDDRNAPAGLR